MAEPFLAEVRMFSFDFPPKGWAACNGQVLPIAQNQALFALLGTNFGGNGVNTFALPDLRGRTPIHDGPNGQGSHSLGELGGEENHGLSIAEMPAHIHGAQGTAATPATSTQANSLLAPTAGGRRPLVPYGPPNALAALHPASVASQGAGQGHLNMQPFLTINFCIALQGIFPSQT